MMSKVFSGLVAASSLSFGLAAGDARADSHVEQLVAVFDVGPSCPYAGQDWRCSDNRSVLPEGVTSLVWRTSPSDAGGQIRFSVARDVPYAPDDTLLEGLADGVVTRVVSDRELYIGGVNGNRGSFQVRVYALK